MIIVFEGIDGSGKTTSINILKKILKNVYVFKFPTKDFFGRKAKEFMGKEDPRVVSMLFSIDRIKEYKNIVDKARRGFVLIDRWIYSNIAYQSYFMIRDFGISLKEAVNYILHLEDPKLPVPQIDYVFYIYSDFENVIKRIGNQIREEEVELLKHAYKVYEFMYEKWRFGDPYGARWVKIENNGSLEELEEKLKSVVKKYLNSFV